MLLQNIEHIGLRLASLSAAIWASEKTNLFENIINGNETPEIMALKMSAFLSGSEYVGDMVLSRTIGITAPKLYSTLGSFGYAFVSNAIVLYAFNKLSIDNKIISEYASPEMKAVQLAVLFVVVQEVSHYLLSYVMKSYY